MLLCIGFSKEEIALYRPTDDEYREITLSVGSRFRCGGTTNVWRITDIDKHASTVKVIREGREDQGEFTWHYRSACAMHVPLLHAINVEITSNV